MENKNRIYELCCFLISKGVSSPLKLQKLLFFIRYEELKYGDIKNSFFSDNNNFQAWIYGPVNHESYKCFQNYFWGLDEKEPYSELNDIIVKEINKKYGDFFIKWDAFSSSELVNKSHQNLAWINARGNIDHDTASTNTLDESDKSFLKFKSDN